MPYGRRRPERTLLCRSVQTHFANWLALRRDAFDYSDPAPTHVEREFRRYWDGHPRSRLAHARCGECRHDFLAAFS